MCLGAKPAAMANMAPPRRRAVHVESVMMKRSRQSYSSGSNSVSSWSSMASGAQGSASGARESVSGRWVADNECASCRKCDRAFSLMNRRHHCRVCGFIYCNSCSRTRMLLATARGELPKRQRVCDPCATQAQSNAALYDIDDSSETLSVSNASSARFSDFSVDTLTTQDITFTETAPSVNFMLASMVCFAASFWFLKDEVAYSNPAIWILLAGFLRNLYQLVISLGLLGDRVRQQTESIHVEEQQHLSVHDHHQHQHQHHDLDHGMEHVSSLILKENPLNLSEARKAEMLTKADQAMDTLWEIGMSQDNWAPEPTAFPIDDVALHSRDGKPARVYKCEAELELSPEELFDVLHGQFETSSSWNVTAAGNEILQTLNEETDVVHVTSAAALGGMISSRDFVNTRTWRKKEGGYIIGSICAGKNLVKPAKGVTRGENGVTGFIILPHESSPFKSRFIWILNCDIKGYFPGSLIRKGSLSELCCFIRNLRRHLAVTVDAESSEEISS